MTWMSHPCELRWMTSPNCKSSPSSSGCWVKEWVHPEVANRGNRWGKESCKDGYLKGCDWLICHRSPLLRVSPRSKELWYGDGTWPGWSFDVSVLPSTRKDGYWQIVISRASHQFLDWKTTHQRYPLPWIKLSDINKSSFILREYFDYRVLRLQFTIQPSSRMGHENAYPVVRITLKVWTTRLRRG